MSSPCDLDRARLAGERQRHQQRGEELARDVAAHRDGVAERDASPGRIASGGKPSLARGSRSRAPSAAQRIDQVADRPLVHARHAREPVVAAARARAPRSAAGTRCRRCRGRARPRLHRERARRTPVTAYSPLPARVQATPSARSASRMHARVVGVEQRRAMLGLAVARARRAAACGWRCSSSPAAAPCPRRARAGARSRCARDLPPLVAVTRRPAQPGAARRARLANARSSAVAVACSISCAEALELVLVAAQLREQRVAVREADVAPHLRVARGDAREVAEAAARRRRRARRDRRASASSCTSAYASTCGRWLTAASTASCSSASIAVTRAPHASQAPRTRSTASGAVLRQAA